MRQLAAEQDAVGNGDVPAGLPDRGIGVEHPDRARRLIAAPPKDNLILPGITYGAIYDFARQGGLPFEIRPITASEVWAADELWCRRRPRKCWRS
jgi:D-alanine transaminase